MAVARCLSPLFTPSFQNGNWMTGLSAHWESHGEETQTLFFFFFFSSEEGWGGVGVRRREDGTRRDTVACFFFLLDIREKKKKMGQGLDCPTFPKRQFAPHPLPPPPPKGIVLHRFGMRATPSDHLLVGRRWRWSWCWTGEVKLRFAKTRPPAGRQAESRADSGTASQTRPPHWLRDADTCPEHSVNVSDVRAIISTEPVYMHRGNQMAWEIRSNSFTCSPEVLYLQWVFADFLHVLLLFAMIADVLERSDNPGKIGLQFFVHVNELHFLCCKGKVSGLCPLLSHPVTVIFSLYVLSFYFYLC
ncbi:uncharacterized protein LOC118563111 [Fundulus heteroclitus]|uniref:uncharacterized protein LOC118563111 n=1 Tax=Fundulus heteroclitus TaxID=8078 RepID=UPI00165ABB6E|nr:uncharacterized protein LOC118563111 [Fundulus heteroclitus]